MKPVELDAARRRLSACHDVYDLRVTARRLIPRPVFDYVDGGADEELSMAANVRAFRRWRFQPRALTEITAVDTATRVLDRDAAAAAGARADRVHADDAPGGRDRRGALGAAARAALHAVHHGDHHHRGRRRGSPANRRRAALTCGSSCTSSGTSGLTKELVDRAAAAGYRVLVVTVDTLVTGHRTRDERNGLIIPPALTPQTLASIAARPGYWMRMLRSDGASTSPTSPGPAR